MKFLFAALMAGWMVLVANANAARADVKTDFQCGDVDSESSVSIQDGKGEKQKEKQPSNGQPLNEKKSG